MTVPMATHGAPTADVIRQGRWGSPAMVALIGALSRPEGMRWLAAN